MVERLSLLSSSRQRVPPLVNRFLCPVVVGQEIGALENLLSHFLSTLPLETLQQLDEMEVRHAAAWAIEGDANIPIILPDLLSCSNAIQADLPTIWLGVPARGDFTSLFAFLNEEEKAHVLRLRNRKDQWSVASARAAVRILLSRHLDCPAQDIVFIRDDYGKPWLDLRSHGNIAEQLHFSISHTRDLVAVAIGRSRVGIDVEIVREFPDIMQIATMQFAKEMVNDLRSAHSDAEMVELFYRFWTLGEAFIKATGEGIAQGLQSFAFSAYGRPALKRVSKLWGPTDRWSFGVLRCGARPAVSQS
jgi:4'-phosphopantetheinyl transferase